MSGIWAQHANCNVEVLFNLTIFGIFLSFWALTCLMLALVAWEQLRRPQRSPEQLERE